jgi:hypothetical protein
MKALDRALAYFTLAAPYMDAFDVISSYRQTPPPVSRNTKRTKGRKFASQKSRANRRKAKR